MIAQMRSGEISGRIIPASQKKAKLLRETQPLLMRAPRRLLGCRLIGAAVLLALSGPQVSGAKRSRSLSTIGSAQRVPTHDRHHKTFPMSSSTSFVKTISLLYLFRNSWHGVSVAVPPGATLQLS